MGKNITESQFEEDDLFPSNFAVGTTFLLFFGPLYYLYSLCIKAMQSSHELSTNSCYILMAMLGRVDLVQIAAVGLYLGLVALIGQPPPPDIMKFVGALTGFAWDSSLTLMCIITVNRFFLMYNTHWNHKLFGTPNKARIWVLAALIVGAFWGLLQLLPGIDNVLDMYTLTFWAQGPYVALMYAVEFHFNNVLIIIMSVLYILIIVKVRKMSSQISNEQTGASVSKKERSVILQAFVICFITILNYISFQFYDYLTFMPERLMGVIKMFLWALNPAINPIVYILLNPTIYKGVKNILLGHVEDVKSVSKVTTVTQKREGGNAIG